MPKLSGEEILLWKEKQIKKGGDDESLCLLLDLLGGVSKKKLNILKIKIQEKVEIKSDLKHLESIWQKHLTTFEPIQHLVGFSYWRDLKLKVSNNVLIPRPETELLIEIVFEIFRKKDERIIFADLGTGSGAIAIALALANPLWVGIATDIDKKALKIATNNYANYSNHSNLSFSYGNWWDPLKTLKGKIDLAISNPPYIPLHVYEKLPIEVKNFEPEKALLGGEYGLDHINQIIQDSPKYLKEKGWLFLENHFDQGSIVTQLLLENGFTEIKVLKDFSGIGRFTIGRYK